MHWGIAVKSMAIGTVLIFAATSALGQGRFQRMSPEEQAKRQLAADSALVAELGLEGEQATQMLALLGEAHEKQQAAVAKMRASGSREGARAMRGEIADIREETDAKVGALLSEDQFAQYKEIQKKRDEERRQRRRGRRM